MLWLIMNGADTEAARASNLFERAPMMEFTVPGTPPEDWHINILKQRDGPRYAYIWYCHDELRYLNSYNLIQAYYLYIMPLLFRII